MSGDRAMAWAALMLAGLFEIAWALGLKYSDGFTRFWPSVGMAASVAASFALMSLTLRSIPFGTAYAVWTGIGAAGSVLAGILLFGEQGGVLRLACIALIVTGILGIRLATPDH